jgi:hypothetical protein
MAKGNKRAVLVRTAKFPIYPSLSQEAIFLIISENLRRVWNEALPDRMRALASYRASKVLAYTIVSGAVAEVLGSKVKQVVKMPTFYDQVNELTKKREEESFGSVPRNWQEETLDRLAGSFDSFFALVKNGDYDARPPRERGKNFFQVIPGRSGFTIKNGFIEFAPNTFGKGVLRFAIPQYQQDCIANGTPKKFVIARNVADLSKESGWSISVNYEIPQPVMLPQEENQTVYLALGASSVGVVCGTSASPVEDVLFFWRPDKHWKKKIEEIEDRIKKSNLVQGSLAWCRLMTARKEIFARMSRQQRQNHREMVAKLLLLGKHFIVTDYVVRSKKGKLADSKDTDRGGSQGLNWSSQNTGSFLDFVMHLEEKVKEVGGSVTKHRLTTKPPQGIGIGSKNKVAMARHLRREILLPVSV